MSYKYSVLVPVYNAEKYLKECIDSVLNQTYQNFEMVLVDDGSLDSSGEICDYYMKQDSRIKVHHQTNQGLIMTRRKTIDYATGDYLLFLDSDDYWDRDLIETIDRIFCETDCDLIIYNFKRIINNNIKCVKAVFEDKSVFDNNNKEMLFRELASSYRLNSLCIKAVKSTIIDKVDYSEYRKIKHGEDLLQSLPLIYKAKKIVYTGKAMYNYRMTPNSITNTVNVYMFIDISIVRSRLLEYLRIMKYDTQDNLQIFFNFYCISIFKCISKIVNSNISRTEKYKLLFQIQNIPLFIETKNYMTYSKLSLYQRIRLYILRKSSISSLYIYARVIFVLKQIKHTFRHEDYNRA